MIFRTNKKDYILIKGLRDKIKPGWQEMLKPARERKIDTDLYAFLPHIARVEIDLARFDETLVGKEILEAGCSYGERCFLMAKYQDTRVHGIDVDEYIADQSPDLNFYNPEDIKFVHDKIEERREELFNKLPDLVSDKVTFQTCGMGQYIAVKPHDLIVSWDTLEHILDLPEAFNCMASALKKGGIAYHEYNPFFAFNGGHSLCTLDFLYGHCSLSTEDFERYVQEIRPEEEKIDLNFYHRCLNRVTRGEIRELALKAGFEILEFQGKSSYGKETEKWIKETGNEILEETQKIYSKVLMEDLLCDSVHLILRKI